MNDSLLNMLRQLRLSGLAQSLEVRLQEASGHSLSHIEFLELILQDELAVRSDRERETIEQIRQLAETGLHADQIAQRLNAEERIPCRGQAFTGSIVIKLRQRHGIQDNLEKVRHGGLPCGYTLREMAHLIGIDPSWIYRQLGRDRLELSRDPRYGCYLFPRTQEAIDTMKGLKTGTLQHASFPEVHHDG